MQFDDEFIFFLGEVSPLEVRPQVVYPSEAATFPTSEKACGLGERPPAALAVCPDISDEAIIFLLGPCPFVCMSLLTARRPPH